jgi:hypothetical protein
MRVSALAAVVAATFLTGNLHAQGVSSPAQIVIKEADIRGLLPPDGTLIEQGQISIEYLGLTLGREVRAQGKRVYVSDRPVGERGLALRDGHVELNIGAHSEKEERVAFFKPTFAVDLAVRAKVGLDDQLNVRLDLEWLYIQGDNVGGKIVVAVAKGKLQEAAEREAKAFAARLNDEIRKKLPPGLRVFAIRIEPGQIVITPKAG